MKDVSIAFAPKQITALIGPSGCGKSTLLRTINRMNDLIPGARVEGQVLYHGVDLYGTDVDPVEVRRRIGMVFQKPNPFPKSIYDNVAFGPRINGSRATWTSSSSRASGAPRCGTTSRTSSSSPGSRCRAASSSGCASRGPSPPSPDVILMDEPCSALDPRSTLQIEELMCELKQNYTIIIVTHNMQQAARASDYTVFMNMAEDRAGYVVEDGPDARDLHQPEEPADRGLRLRPVRLSGGRPP